MATSQELQVKSLENEKKTTNWYLIGGVALATGLVVAATVTVLASKKRTTQKFEFEGEEEELTWIEDSQFFATLFATTKKTFSHVWGSAMKGLSNLDTVVRRQLGSGEQPTALFPNQAEVQEKTDEMLTGDDDFYTSEF